MMNKVYVSPVTRVVPLNEQDDILLNTSGEWDPDWGFGVKEKKDFDDSWDEESASSTSNPSSGSLWDKAW